MPPLCMKKVIRVEDLCCKKCAERAANKLELLEGVKAARSNLRKNVVLVEHDETVTDDMLKTAVENAGFKVLTVEVRKGLFY